HAAEHAHERHVADAHATYLLGLVHHCGAGAVVVSGFARRRHSVAAGSYRRHELLYSRRSLRERLALWQQSKLPLAYWRFADSVAAPVLVFRASGSLHRVFAGHWRYLAYS